MRVRNGLVHPLGTWLARGLLPGHGLFPVAAAAGATPQKVTRCWHSKILKPYFFTPYTTKMTFNFRVLTWKWYHFNPFNVLYFVVGVSTSSFFSYFYTFVAYFYTFLAYFYAFLAYFYEFVHTFMHCHIIILSYYNIVIL